MLPCCFLKHPIPTQALCSLQGPLSVSVVSAAGASVQSEVLPGASVTSLRRSSGRGVGSQKFGKGPELQGPVIFMDEILLLCEEPKRARIQRSRGPCCLVNHRRIELPLLCLPALCRLGLSACHLNQITASAEVRRDRGTCRPASSALPCRVLLKLGGRKSPSALAWVPQGVWKQPLQSQPFPAASRGSDQVGPK